MNQTILTSVLDNGRLRDGEQIWVEMERGLLGQVRVRRQPCQEMDEEVERAAVTRVFDLTDILELVMNRLDERPLAEQELVGQGEQSVLHVRAELRNQVQAVLDQERFGERRRDGALVPEQLPKEATDQAGQRTPVIQIARAQAEGEHFSTVVDHEVQFAAREPAHRRLAAAGVDAEDPMLADARRVTDGARGGVNEAAAGALPELGDRKGQPHTGEKRDEARVAHQPGKLCPQVDLDVLGGEALEGALPRLLKEDEKGHDLAGTQAGGASTMTSRADLLSFPQRLKALPKRVHRAIQIEYTHEQCLQSGMTRCWKPHLIPAEGILFIQD
jgi:hypothetical protein